MTDFHSQNDLASTREFDPQIGQGPALRRPSGQKLKVTFVQTQAENAGAQEIARQLAYGVERNGWQPRQVFFFRRTDAFDGEKNVFFCSRYRPTSPVGILKLFFKLYKEFRREAPDAVVTFQHYGNLIAAPIARLAGVRNIVVNQVSAAEHIPAWVRIIDRWLGLIGCYDRIVVNSATTEALYSVHPRSYRTRVVRIDHGFFDKSVVMDKKDARLQLGLPQKVGLLGCAARLHPLKQIDCAIRVLAINTQQHLVVAGQGADRPRLEALARELKVMDRLHLVGELDAHSMGVFLGALDCFVFPSSTETFGLAPIEAAQAGIPVVSNDLNVLRDSLSFEGQPCALFVDVRDTVAFAAAVQRLFNETLLSAQLCANGRRLKERFPLEKMVDEYMALLKVKAN